MARAVCPGSFDPVTNGHLDVVHRAATLFDHVTVAVGVNGAKNGLFDLEERMALIREAVTAPNVDVDHFDGLLVTFCRDRGIAAIVKGLRAVSDFDSELQMAQMNSTIADVETVFLPTAPAYSFLSSSLVKEVVRHGGDVAGLVPPGVLAHLHERLDRPRP